MGENKCHWFWWGRCWHLWKSCGVLLGMPKHVHGEREREGLGFPTLPSWPEPGRCLPLAMGVPSVKSCSVFSWWWSWDEGFKGQLPSTSALSQRAALSAGPGQAVVCPLCHPTQWVITLPRHSLCLPSLREILGTFPVKTRGWQSQELGMPVWLVGLGLTPEGGFCS